MSHQAKPTIDTPKESKLFGTYAEFDNVDQLLAGCRKVRDAGYIKTDAYTPFPVHGIDKALGIKPTILPWICLACGLTGTSIALAMQIWMNAIDYPYIISGKPFISMPAFIPVTFELTVLLAAFGAFFGMLALNKLPMFSNPVFTDPRFDRATDDRFFLFVSAEDAKYNQASITKMFGSLGSGHVADIHEDTSSNTVPRPFFVIVGLLALFSTVPLLTLARMRVTNSGSPRFHVFYDMDFSPSKDAQQTTTLFADGRTMRPDVPGTVAVGQFNDSIDFYTGIDMNQLSMIDQPRATRLVRALLDEPANDESATEEPATEEPANESTMTPADEQVADEPIAEGSAVDAQDAAAAGVGAAAAAAIDKTPWLTTNPLPITAQSLENGRKNYEIYCAVCHGNDGGGNGLVNRRAQRILATAWVQPSSLHQDTLFAEQYADGKLFNTISNGIRKMPGYSAQIPTKNRWAIVAYVRALQQSQNASIDELPADKRSEVKKRQAEIEQRLREQADAEKKKAEAAANKI